MATYQDGNVRRATPNTVTSMKRSAENRRCPACGRKSALKRVPDEMGSVTYCRWDGCRYERVFDRDSMTFSESGLPS